MTRPRILDLFCGAGGAAMGYHRAGFDVIGIDIDPRQLEVYPFPSILADATNPPVDLTTFDAIHASPPCQRYSTATASTGDITNHPDLLEPTRQLLADSRLPTIIENVEGAPLRKDVRLCGSSFNMRVRRHRVFELNRWTAWAPPACQHRRQRADGPIVDVTGNAGGRNQTLRPGKPLKYMDETHAREVMGMPWSTRWGCVEAIPPAYTEWLGGALLQHLQTT